MQALKKIISGIFLLLFILVAVSLIYIFIQVLTHREAQIFGYRIYIVVTDSMSPELETGDVILSKSVNPENLKNGDNITFLGTEGNQKGLFITHKIIEEPYYDDSGNGYVLTKGVKENALPDSPVAFNNVKAVMVSKLKIVGFLFSLIKKPTGFILIVILPLILLTVYQLYKIAVYNAKKQNEKR